MRGNEIVKTAEPKGQFVEGFHSGADALPGTCLQIKAGSLESGGRLDWEVYNKTGDGVPAVVAVLNFDYLTGKTKDSVVKDGDHIFLYIPAAGEELNMRVSAPGTGTGNAVAVGDTFMIDDGTGLLVADSGGASKPFTAMEAVSDVTAEGTLVLCQYTGH